MQLDNVLQGVYSAVLEVRQKVSRCVAQKRGKEGSVNHLRVLFWNFWIILQRR